MLCHSNSEIHSLQCRCSKGLFCFCIKMCLPAVCYSTLETPCSSLWWWSNSKVLPSYTCNYNWNYQTRLVFGSFGGLKIGYNNQTREMSWLVLFYLYRGPKNHIWGKHVTAGSLIYTSCKNACPTSLNKKDTF